jgi:hypothetical protein
MIIFWRGWGWFVFFGTFAWIFGILGITMGTGFYEPDKATADASVDRMFALAFALSAVSVFLIARYRNSRSRKVADPGTGEIYSVPNVDEFMFISMKYWTPVLVAAAAGMLIKSFFE